MLVARLADPKVAQEAGLRASRVVEQQFGVDYRRQNTRILGFSQPAVSQSLQRAEARLGVPLVQRLGRSVRLTEAGEIISAAATPVEGALNEASAALSRLWPTSPTVSWRNGNGSKGEETAVAVESESGTPARFQWVPDSRRVAPYGSAPQTASAVRKLSAVAAQLSSGRAVLWGGCGSVRVHACGLRVALRSAT